VRDADDHDGCAIDTVIDDVIRDRQTANSLGDFIAGAADAGKREELLKSASDSCPIGVPLARSPRGKRVAENCPVVTLSARHEAKITA